MESARKRACYCRAVEAADDEIRLLDDFCGEIAVVNNAMEEAERPRVWWGRANGEEMDGIEWTDGV